ncbi:glycoside hydrolase family 27 protein [Atractiella rhizophila]|nr:glycoside hydrolase family 27 protein [Atractiella rhizophila]
MANCFTFLILAFVAGFVDALPSKTQQIPLTSSPNQFRTIGGYVEGFRGWSSWSLQAYRQPGYGFDWLNETNVMEVAEVVSTRLRPFGYRRINLDSGWSGGEDKYGRPIPSLTKFPSGAQALSSFLSDRGLEFGLYFLPGIVSGAVSKNARIFGTSYTAREIIHSNAASVPANAFTLGKPLNYSHPGAQAYIDSIVRQLYDWNVSFVKLDGLVPGSSINQRFPPWRTMSTHSDLLAWRSAIDRLYPGGNKKKIWLGGSWEIPPHDSAWIATTTDSWRVSIDVEEYGKRLTTWDRVVRNSKKGALWTSTGEWDRKGLLDLDSIPIGDLDLEEARSMITIWAIMGGPFYSGDDLRTLPESYFTLLTNPSVLEIHRLAATSPARLLGFRKDLSAECTLTVEEAMTLEAKRKAVRRFAGEREGSPTFFASAATMNPPPHEMEWVHQRWWSQWEDGTVIIALINAGELTKRDHADTIALDIKDFNLPQTSYHLFDAWDTRELGMLTVESPLSFSLERHGSILLRLSPA